MNYLKSIFWIYANNQKYNYSRDEYTSVVTRDLEYFKRFIVQYRYNYSYDSTQKWEYSWTYSKALLFTITIMTTIGYGNIFPTTNTGRMFCIVYALVGIPLLLVFMANVGDLLGATLKWIYSRVCCAWCRATRKKNQMMNRDYSEELYELNDRTEIVEIPIIICLILIVGFLFIGAFVFSSWEGWSLGTAFYFCFISLTTIGFGDKVPLKSFLHYDEGAEPFMKMVFTLAYIIFGIALVSMCIQLMQEKMMATIASVSRFLFCQELDSAFK